MNPISIAFPCINRPELVELGLSTLVKHLKLVDFSKSTININIDPVPIYNGRERIEEIAKKYIGNVTINYTIKPSYPKAYIHVLKQSILDNNELIFFCPDDWKFVKDFSILDIKNRFNLNTGVKSISLNNDWEHSNVFGDKHNVHLSLEKGGFRSTPAFYDTKFVKSFIDKIEAKPCPLEGSLNKIFFNKQNCYSMWLSDRYEYFCSDTGIKWRTQSKIKHNMIHKCGRYKMCIYCGNLKWRYICKDISGNTCINCDVICSEKCWDIHCNLFHKKDKNQYTLYNNFPNEIDFNNYHKT